MSLLTAIVFSMSTALASPAPSATFATFKDLCLASAAGPADALAKADAAGWTKPPAGMQPPSAATGQFSMKHYDIRMRQEGGTQEMLVTGLASLKMDQGDPVDAGLCALFYRPYNNQDAVELQSWVGLQPSETTPDHVGYAFVESPQGRRAVNIENIHSAATLPAGLKMLGALANARSGAGVLVFLQPIAP